MLKLKIIGFIITFTQSHVGFNGATARSSFKGREEKKNMKLVCASDISYGINVNKFSNFALGRFALFLSRQYG